MAALNGPAAKIHPDNYRFLREHIRLESGIVLDEDKHYLIEARLLPVALDHGLTGLDDLCARLRCKSEAKLLHSVVEAMTTNETYFFREPAHFDALKTVVLPPLIESRKATRRLSVWSAAASSGQEAYSLAMLLLEMGLQHWDVKILGTDLSSNMLKRAAAASYSQLEVNRGLPASLLVKYFKQSGPTWELKPQVTKLASFQPLDLRAGMRGLGPFDIVFCRNVLIYFDLETKLRVAEQLRSTLSPGGYLFLGASEVNLPVGSRFARQALPGATFYKAV